MCPTRPPSRTPARVATRLHLPRIWEWALAVTSTGVLSPFGPKIGLPNLTPRPTATATLTRSSQARPSLPPSHWNRMKYLWSVVTSSHDAVQRRRLLLPQTQLGARDRIPNRLIDSQSFLGVPGWGRGANVLRLPESSTLRRPN